MTTRNKLGILLLALTMLGLFSLLVIFRDTSDRAIGLGLIGFSIFIVWATLIMNLIFGDK